MNEYGHQVFPADFGFSAEASGLVNRDALQKALDMGGTVEVSRPGTYDLAGTVYIGSDTTLRFTAGAKLRKVNEAGEFCHVILNRGALSKTYDERIVIENLFIEVNGMDNRLFQVFGLHGQLALHYVRDVRIEGFRCLDIGKAQYGIHICTFEDARVYNAVIKGDKDGVHLGRGKRFHISGCVFQTYDDAVALNAHDYDVGNPEMGWIESGVVENCHDLGGQSPTGYFCRILAGAWRDWCSGMEVQKSDTVVSASRLYRVSAQPDGTMYRSLTQPTHERGSAVLDGITWVMAQEEATYTAGVRDVTFRDIFLEKPRIALSVHFDTGRYSRSYYPGAVVPVQQRLRFESMRVLHDQDVPFISANTPVDAFTLTNCDLRNAHVVFHNSADLPDLGVTQVGVSGCSLGYPLSALVRNEAPGKRVVVHAPAQSNYPLAGVE